MDAFVAIISIIMGCLLSLFGSTSSLEPLHYGYSIELTVEADGKVYSGRATYDCHFEGRVEQQGISWAHNLLRYKGEGDALAVRLADDRVILVDFKLGKGFCTLNDDGLFWGWRGVKDLGVSGDHDRGFEIVRKGYIDREDLEEAKSIVEKAYDEEKTVDLLTFERLPFSFWLFDNADDPSTMRGIDPRVPNRALGEDVRLKSLIMRPSRDGAQSKLADTFPWAVKDTSESFFASHRWLAWIVVGDIAKFPVGADYPGLPGQRIDGEARFKDVSEAFGSGAGLTSASNRARIAKERERFVVSRIDISGNKVELRWHSPSELQHPWGDRDYVLLDNLALEEKSGGTARWSLWNPEFCVSDDACFRLETDTYGDGYPFSWNGAASTSFHAIGRGGGRGSVIYVLDSETDIVYAIRLDNLGGKFPYISTRYWQR
ncbi:hypothetical protein HPQ64_14760 [Rhizobiales bacterium]|uniref:hypothetical protein n=1 Tax=Hongsoonwoonella zoysiae TaxID=2821844 RepID=UPI001560E91E|nr:hypothetical protein [Hongsoonwoonella zoysiae]NRG18952.1 hypothetical protein [Hongsoonwoonella zoysiae]